jgi:hypothetical protein
MEPADQELPSSQKRGGRWQFGLAALLGTMMLLCLPFALWGAVLRANPADQFWLMVLCAAAPLGVLTLAALSVSAGRFVRSLRRKPAATSKEQEF